LYNWVLSVFLYQRGKSYYVRFGFDTLGGIFFVNIKFNHEKNESVDLLHFMVWASLVPPLPLLILSYFTETSDPLSLLQDTSMQLWMAVLYTGFISTLLAFAIWGYLLKTYTFCLIDSSCWYVGIWNIFK